jgi:hypothetical protein
VAQARELLDAPCELRVLQELQRESEALRVRVPEAEQVRARTEGSKKWLQTVSNQVLRRASSRCSKGAAGHTRLSIDEVEQLLLDVQELQLEAAEIEQARDKLDEAREWRDAASALLLPPRPMTDEMHGALEALHARTEVVHVQTPEMAQVEERLSAVNGWLSRARSALDGKCDAILITTMLREATMIGVQLSELDELSALLKEQKWQEAAEVALAGPASLHILEALSAAAEGPQPAERAEMVRRLNDKLRLAREWSEDLARQMEQRPSLREAIGLLAEVEAAGVIVQELENQRSVVARGRAWQELARKAQARTHSIASHRIA